MDLSRYMARPGELPLESSPQNGGFFGIFRRVACVGDSLSSGEMVSLDEAGNRGYHDYYDYSWGQVIARTAGCTVYNFSKGGMTAKKYMESFAAERGFWDPSLAAQAYIVALGVNDLLNRHQEIGSAADIRPDAPETAEHPDTFAGYYGALLTAYRRIAPRSRLFLMTMPRQARDADDPARAERKAAHCALLWEIARLYPDTYVLDFYTYAPPHEETYTATFGLGGHLTAAGYRITAQQVMAYVDYIIRHHPREFADIHLCP